MKTYFKEEQKFTQWWLWLILIPIGCLPIYGVIKQFILKEPFGSKPMSNVGLVIFLILTIAFIFMFLKMKLKTEINDTGIYMRFIPFAKKQVSWKEIKSIEIINYGFVGYGIRLSIKYGTVYNTSGNKGLLVSLNNGKTFVIGTQKEKELNNILSTLPIKS